MLCTVHVHINTDYTSHHLESNAFDLLSFWHQRNSLRVLAHKGVPHQSLDLNQMDVQEQNHNSNNPLPVMSLYSKYLPALHVCLCSFSIHTIPAASVGHGKPLRGNNSSALQFHKTNLRLSSPLMFPPEHPPPHFISAEFLQVVA